MEIKDIRLTWDNLLKLNPAQQKSALEELFSEYSAMSSGYTWKSNPHVFENTTNDIPIPLLNLEHSINTFSGLSSHKLIEGNSYDTLLFMQHTHKGQIGFIYSTLPANIGEDFEFNGKTVSKNDSYSRGKWVSYNEKRLKLCRNLLKPYGIICIGIVDSLLPQTRLMLDEIFGINNYITTITVSSSTKIGAVVNTNEYILVYSNNLEKSLDKIGISDTDLLMEGEETAGYSSQKAFQMPVSIYWGRTKSPDEPVVQLKGNQCIYNNGDKVSYSRKMDHIGPFQLIGLAKTGKDSTRDYCEGMFFPIYYKPKPLKNKMDIDYKPELSLEPLAGYIPITPKTTGDKDGRWRWSLERVTNTLKTKPYMFAVTHDIKGNYAISFKRYDRFFYINEQYNVGYSYKRVNNLWTRQDYYSGTGTRHVKGMLGKEADSFPYYKSIKLISDLIMTFTANNEIILDPYCDNGDTAEAVLTVMQQYGRNHSFIAISPRAEITNNIAFKRLKKLSEGYQEKNIDYKYEFKLLSYKLTYIHIPEDEDLEDIIQYFIPYYSNIASFKYTVTSQFYTCDQYDIYMNQRNAIAIIIKTGFRPDVYKSITTWIESISEQYKGKYRIYLYALTPSKSLNLNNLLPDYVHYETYPVPLLEDIQNQNKVCSNKIIINDYFNREDSIQ